MVKMNIFDNGIVYILLVQSAFIDKCVLSYECINFFYSILSLFRLFDLIFLI